MQRNHGVKKTLRSDSTALINSMLKTPQVMCSEQLTENEQITAGLFQTIDGPFKILYGTCMMAAGIILTPIPGLVMNVKTREAYNANGASAEITGIGLKFIKPIPFYFERKSYYEGKICKEKGYNLSIQLGLPDPHKHEILPNNGAENTIVHAKTTVDGLGLFSSGVGRIAAGVCDPAWGIPKAGYYGIKAAFS